MQKTLNNSFVQVTSDKVNRKALIIGIGCMFFQQISGINILIFYLKNIFDTFGSNISSDMATIIISVVQVGICITVTLTILSRDLNTQNSPIYSIDLLYVLLIFLTIFLKS